MSIKLKKIREAIYNNPELIPILLKDTSIPKGMIYRELRKAVPCRIGIEFELSGDFAGEFCKKYEVSEFSNKKATKFYNVKDILCDEPHYIFEEVEATIGNGITMIPVKHVDYDKLVELRISISDFHQLKGLYHFMQDVSEFCRIHEGGGIHIHVDMSKFFKGESKKMYEVSKYIERHLNEVVAIFPKYTGKFNKRKVGVCRKATYLNISRLNTFEFRIAPLTFDYSTLMTWIRNCIKFRNKVISECSLKALDEKKICEEYNVVEMSQSSYSTPNQFRIVRNRATSDTRLDGMYDIDSDYVVTNGTITSDNVVTNYNLI